MKRRGIRRRKIKWFKKEPEKPSGRIEDTKSKRKKKSRSNEDDDFVFVNGNTVDFDLDNATDFISDNAVKISESLMSELEEQFEEVDEQALDTSVQLGKMYEVLEDL